MRGSWGQPPWEAREGEAVARVSVGRGREAMRSIRIGGGWGRC